MTKDLTIKNTENIEIDSWEFGVEKVIGYWLSVMGYRLSVIAKSGFEP